MKSKKLFLLSIFVFGLFFFLLPNSAEAIEACTQTCKFSSDPRDCAYHMTNLGASRTALIGDVWYTLGPPYSYTEVSSCSDSEGICKNNAFPTGNNRQACTAVDYYWDLWAVECTWWTSSGGKWDVSDSKCVLCDGKTENNVLGYTSSYYCNDGSNHICAYNDDPDGDPGDTDCESACGASPECDEEDYGVDVPVPGGVCNYCDFIIVLYSLNVYHSGAGTGSGTVTDTGIDCGSDCFQYYIIDTSVILTAAPDAGSEFAGWSGDCSGTGNCTLTMNSDKSVTATFNSVKPDLIITDIEEFSSDKMVYYDIKNQGEGDADFDSYSELFVDDVSEDDDFVNDIYVEAGETSYDEYFNGWTCDPGIEYEIEVCADKDDYVDEEDEDNNCRTETLTCPEEECTGNVDLTLNPSSVEPSYYPVTAGVSGLSGCDGKTSYIKYNSCSGTTECTCTISGSGCSCPFTAPSSEGTYTYYACVDKNDDSDFSDSGESDWADLTVTVTPFDFSVSVSPGSSQVNRGDAIWTTVTANLLSGDPQTVTFSVTASTLPGNTSVGFYMDDHTTPSDSCTLPCSREMTIITTINTPLGPHENIEIKGSAGGEDRYDYYDLTVNEPGEEIIPPIVETVGYENLTTTSVTLKGRLTDCGRADTCLVWFEYATSDYWNTNSSYSDSTLKQTVDCTTVTIPHDFDSGSEITGLTPGTTYYFEAFAKNSGSW